MYDYKCAPCGHMFEELVFSSTVSDNTIKCPVCAENKAKRQLSAPAIAVGGATFEPACEKPSCSTPVGFS
jgi:putative FmdB family regulatory protein